MFQICKLSAETEEDALQFLAAARLTHAALRHAVASIDQIFAKILPLATIYCIFDVIFALFACLSVFILNKKIIDGDDISKVNFNLLWFTLFLSNSSYLTWQCEQVSKEVRLVIILY